MDFQLVKGEQLRIYLAAEENSAVQIAAHNLVRDLHSVLEAEAQICTKLCRSTKTQTDAEVCSSAEACASTEVCGSMDVEMKVPVERKIDTEKNIDESDCKIIIRPGLSDNLPGADRLKDANDNYRKESFSIAVSDGRLFITGADRRGTIYGIYDFCESIGVSPWYWWADVPVKKKEKVHLADGFLKTDYPTIEYRGIFINDEEELENWVQAHMGEDTIGVKTYEPIFELLLRLKANYIWPAMHVNSFNVKQENGALADRMGIVVGTSHCDILMRSNNREWYPWLESMGYQDVEYDYSIEGRNRDILNQYWDDSIKQNKDFEVCYTLGMRGIHDWGSSMRAIDSNPNLSASEKKQARVQMLSFIIRSQRKLLAENGVADSMQIFIPYKEVLDLYDAGLEVPEDVTLVWANDNFGYMRRFPSAAEAARPGGNGIYYHVSYWAFPAMDYLFINSTPLSHIRNELRKAYENGIRKLWVLNVGAMKPLEQEMEFFLRYAWEIDKGGDANKTGDINKGGETDKDRGANRGGDTNDTLIYLARWAERNFSIADGMEIAQILTDYAQLTNVRKVEHMSYDLFSQCAYGDEAARRINRYADLYNRANAICGSLPEEEREAFFQLILMKIHAAYYINCDYYFADRSYLCQCEGKLSAADYYTGLSRRADDYKREMLEYYNKKMCGGKWDRILTPEEYKPPVTAMFPPRTPSLIQGENRLGVVLWDHEEELCLDPYSVNPKWLELYNPGEDEIAYEIEAEPGIVVSEASGKFRYEKRIFVSADRNFAAEKTAIDGSHDVLSCKENSGDKNDFEGRKEITIRNKKDHSVIFVPVCFVKDSVPEDFEGYVEADGYLSIPADGCAVNTTKGCAANLPADGYRVNDSWRILPHLGRGEGNVAEGSGEGNAAEGSREENASESYARRDTQNAADDVWNNSLSYAFYLRSNGAFQAEMFRFPTLNSTGRIRAFVRIDGGEEILVESISNDEWRGTWKQNVMSNVDRLLFELPHLEAGAHTLEIVAIDRYFTFSSIVIYTKPQKPCYLAPRTSYYRRLEGQSVSVSQTDSENASGIDDRIDDRSCPDERIPQLPEDIYRIKLSPRPTVYAGSKCWINNGLIDSNIRKSLAAYPVRTKEIRSEVVQENNGQIRIDLQAALVQDENAFIRGSEWNYADSETGLSMYIRKKGLTWKDLETAPSLNYRIRVKESGTYHIWVLMKIDAEPASVAFGMDGRPQPLAEQYNHGELWCYEAKQIWRWTPISDMEIPAGEHIFSLYAVISSIRFDRVYLTRGDELPPDALAWPLG